MRRVGNCRVAGRPLPGPPHTAMVRFGRSLLGRDVPLPIDVVPGIASSRGSRPNHPCRGEGAGVVGRESELPPPRDLAFQRAAHGNGSPKRLRWHATSLSNAYNWLAETGHIAWGGVGVGSSGPHGVRGSTTRTVVIAAARGGSAARWELPRRWPAPPRPSPHGNGTIWSQSAGPRRALADRRYPVHCLVTLFATKSPLPGGGSRS